MRILNKLRCFGCLLFCLLLFAGCSDNEVDNGVGYGYLQLRLFKKQPTTTTFGMSGGSRLEYLKDAKKIEITLIYNDSEVKQTLNLYAVDDEGAEFGLRSEKLQLLTGNYTLTGYKVYGSKIVNDKAEVLQSGSPDETLEFKLESGALRLVEISLDAQLRGKVAFRLEKDFSNIDVPATKAAGERQPDSLFNYEEVKFMEVSLRASSGQAVIKDTLKAQWLRDEDFLSTDSLSLKAGVYTLTQYKLLDSKKTVVLALDPKQTFTVADNKCTRTEVKVVYPKNVRALKDYIALYNIWVKMDGEHWSFKGQGLTLGSNWVFKNRTVDQWGYQPGVDLHSNGRVKAIMLGSFNPKGMVPDEIGELTQLESLFLGTHSEESLGEGGSLSFDMYALYAKGVNIYENRMEIGKERLAIRHSKEEKSLMAKDYVRPVTYKYASVYGQNAGNQTNGITGISKEIGKCQSLSSVFIANGLIEELPDAFGTLQNLTDLEIYNCPMEKFPLCVAQLPSLVSFNFSMNKSVSTQSMTEGLTALFDGKSKSKLQIIYLTDNNLTELPTNMKNLSVLGLLDLAKNKLKTIPTMTRNVSPVQVFLDYNQLEELPGDFCKIDDLEKFSVEGNQLKEFPKMFYKNKYTIEQVNLSDNKIRRFPDGFQGIKAEELNLSFNELGLGYQIKGRNTLPDVLSETQSEINYLRISNNHIDTIPVESFKNLKMLAALECMGNFLQYIPKEFNAENLPYLSGVDMSFNSFVKFPALLLNVAALNQLHLPGQADRQGRRCMKDWPENIEKHYTLKVLSVKDNDIRRIGNFPTMMNYLDISGNVNVDLTIPEEICSRITAGTFVLVYDDTQYIQGCPALGIK